MIMSYQTIKVENQERTWMLTITRPQALNALNSQVLEEIHDFISGLEKKTFSEAAALVITGQGEKAFVAGADIKEINSLTPTEALAFAQKGQKLFLRLEALPIPVIAAVNGFALGGGCELALACDFIYASENAKFGLPEVSLGLIPGFGGTVRLSRVIGQNRAKELIYSGEMISATEALRLGLTNKVLPSVELLPAALAIAKTISGRASVAVAHAKRSVLESFDAAREQAMTIEAREFSALFTTKDFHEGTTAFLEKRKPRFVGE
jgi:enoyl-CoA hydratase